jgi:hypothetical protein
MMDIKRLAAGIIAGAAITAAPVLALGAPASAATNAANPAAAAAHQRVQDQLGSGSTFARASHVMPCGGNINCDYCGCPGGGSP